MELNYPNTFNAFFHNILANTRSITQLLCQISKTQKLECGTTWWAQKYIQAKRFNTKKFKSWKEMMKMWYLRHKVAHYQSLLCFSTKLDRTTSFVMRPADYTHPDHSVLMLQFVSQCLLCVNPSPYPWHTSLCWVGNLRCHLDCNQRKISDTLICPCWLHYCY